MLLLSTRETVWFCPLAMTRELLEPVNVRRLDDSPNVTLVFVTLVNVCRSFPVAGSLFAVVESLFTIVTGAVAFTGSLSEAASGSGLVLVPAGGDQAADGLVLLHHKCLLFSC